ncbi:MAG: N-acyl homoserine lactone hydrolase [Rhodococcus sp. (in: high G+C Gram-positive bacteria)]|jgi:N-acyl homoserine lactone hydrolase
MSLTIRAFCVGRVYGLPKPSFTYLRGYGEVQDLPLIMYVIEGGDSPIVVDTGADLARAWDDHKIKMEQTTEEQPEEVLRAAGIDVRDVAVVVNTHLHWDHSSNNHLFPRARVLVQQSELDYARNPLQWHCKHFEISVDIEPSWKRAEDRIDTVNGDTVIAPGVTLVTLPGHTPGSQGVLVEAESTRYLIAGDCIYLYDNWNGDAEADHIPVGLFTDLVAYDESLRKIEKLDCEVIPSHDFRVVERAIFE